MKFLEICENYFNGFQEIFNHKRNDTTTNVLAILKIVSYFTGVILIGFVAVYGAASLFARVSKKSIYQDRKVDGQAKTILENSISTSIEKLSSALTRMHNDLCAGMMNSGVKNSEKIKDSSVHMRECFD